MEYMEYATLAWEYLPYAFYAFVFLTLIPKSVGKINAFAKANYEANRYKYHRCYGPELCCHILEGGEEHLPKQKSRKAVTRVYPKKQVGKKDAKPASTVSVEEPANVYKRQVHTHTNVNKIAKMFESGGVQKKINRVTPTVLPDFRRCSMNFDDEEEMYERKDSLTVPKVEVCMPKKRENVVLRRLPKLSQELEENNENSSNVLNQMPREEVPTDFKASWRSEPIAIQKPKREIPAPLSLHELSSATPSTMSPSHSSPPSSPHSECSPVALSPLERFAPMLNMKSSLEDIFAAIAKSAEDSDGFLYRSCSSLSPVTSIDDILSERRLSRPLSAYSISDLLNDDHSGNNKALDEASYMESYLKVLNKT
ncbi:uncharacterized protein LOC106082466 [Stomoxys calcitrans]|uniref:uncharacterized protein LOC106082466 n=1 Tax=Stomoxys calcitrans TaxID=35570 RepID=UPI0027E36910|nr:uncharacterized protein LOC106082466 [Stomoxys calcitrans]XP_013100461.2 uncharacterized protein LOC106082466 [Stomoxys calcitrans]